MKVSSPESQKVKENFSSSVHRLLFLLSNRIVISLLFQKIHVNTWSWSTRQLNRVFKVLNLLHTSSPHNVCLSVPLKLQLCSFEMVSLVVAVDFAFNTKIRTIVYQSSTSYHQSPSLFQLVFPAVKLDNNGTYLLSLLSAPQLGTWPMSAAKIRRVPCHRMSLKGFGGDSGKRCRFCSQPQMCDEGNLFENTPEIWDYLGSVVVLYQQAQWHCSPCAPLQYCVELNPSYFYKLKHVSKLVFVAIMGKSDAVTC